MAAKSKSIGDVYNWIIDVIDSCDHPLQIIGARHLIQNFERMMARQNVSIDLYCFMSLELRDRLGNKRFGKDEKVI